MLAGVQIEHEVRKGSLEFCAEIPVNGEARARQFHRTLEIKDPEFSAQIPMRLRGEIELRRRAPSPHFHIILGTVPDRNAFMRQVGDTDKNVTQPYIEIGRSFLE